MKIGLISLVMLAVLAVYSSSPALAAEKCKTISGGTIVDSAGDPVVTGYDQYGYNYQAHMFNGTYDSSDRKLDDKYGNATGEYVDDKLMMKWSDAWIANVDCNNDGKLDRGLVDGEVSGFSKGWVTNHVVGDYSDTDGTHNFTDFVKIVWTGAGSPLWGQYTVVQEVLNDPAGGLNGLYLKEEGITGLGQNDHWTTL